MGNRTKTLSIMMATLSLGLVITSGCAKRVSTSETGEAVKPGTETTTPAAAPVTVAEPPVPQIERMQELALKEEPLKETAKASAVVKAISDIYFDFDRYLIRDDARATLNNNAGALRGKAFKKVVIEGHCDERGTTDYNLALGERRAESTRRHLAALGVDPSMISTVSYGKEKPFCTEHNEDCWQQNRRAHFLVTE